MSIIKDAINAVEAMANKAATKMEEKGHDGLKYYLANDGKVVLPPERTEVPATDFYDIEGFSLFCKESGCEDDQLLRLTVALGKAELSILDNGVMRASKNVIARLQSRHAALKASYSFDDQDDAIIFLRQTFELNEDLTLLLGTVGSIKLSDETVLADDGIAQLVTTRTGAKSGSEKSKAIYELKPFDPYACLDESELSLDVVMRVMRDGTFRFTVVNGPSWLEELDTRIRDAIRQHVGDVFVVM